ncbi:hypothetical protein KFK09_007215 [Dendrobium nobile]|uniref:Uncharacterized protein n=1 Tax=Dendrobium nobile TaxID=94219 RepID=A0A8T3BRB3_DENNO|nr:hypothetical protein KFK09_007215 [Dendrobium nobile]
MDVHVTRFKCPKFQVKRMYIQMSRISLSFLNMSLIIVLNYVTKFDRFESMF